MTVVVQIQAKYVNSAVMLYSTTFHIVVVTNFNLSKQDDGHFDCKFGEKLA